MYSFKNGFRLPCLVMLLCCLGMSSAQQTARYQRDPANTPVIRFSVSIFPGGDDVTIMRIIGASGSIDLVFTTVTTPPETLSATFEIDTATNVVTDRGNSATATVIPMKPGGPTIQFFLQGLASGSTQTATDKQYIVEYDGVSGAGFAFPSGTTSFGGMTANSQVLPSAAPVVALHAYDGATGSDVTELNVNDALVLKFTLTSQNWLPKVVYAGARLTNCIAANNAGFLGENFQHNSANKAETFIDSDGCCIPTAKFLDYSCGASEGFSKDASSTQTTGGVNSYVAVTPDLEVASFFTSGAYDPRNDVYIRCDLTLCYDDTDTSTAGQCGANHCSASTRRRRRSVTRATNTTTVQTKITLMNQKPQQQAACCSETTLFSGTLGALGGLTALIFGVMIIAFLDTTRVFRLRRSGGSSSSSGSTRVTYPSSKSSVKASTIGKM